MIPQNFEYSAPNNLNEALADCLLRFEVHF